MKLLLIGRSAHADVVIADASVSAYHAEVVVTVDDRFYVTDRATAEGTYHRVSASDAWTPVRQAFVEASDELRLGDYVCQVGALLADALEAATGGEQRRPGDTYAGAMPGDGAAHGRPRGAVERDPVTGEIVRRRF